MEPIQNREPRETETREAMTRVEQWSPPGILETPEPPEGYKLRWVRAVIDGHEDTQNLVKYRRQGYEPVYSEESWLPKHWVHDKTDEGKHTGVVRAGDLILCKIREELWNQRKEFYDGRADRLEESIKRQLLRESTPQMPISDDSRYTHSRGGKSFQS